MDTIDGGGRPGRGRRRHSDEFKAQAVQACRQAGVSIASVALSHGLNANLLRRWLIQRSAASSSLSAPAPVTAATGGSPSGGEGKFLPVTLAAGHPPTTDIRIELRRGSTTVSVSWPLQEASACATWLREWLR